MARHRGLSPEDKALWSRVAKTATPMHPARKDLPPEVPHPRIKTPPAARITLPAALLRPEAVKAQPGKRFSLDLATSPREALAGAPLRMDHKKHQQMKRGKLSPEARIDLHGMTLNVAQPALISFLLRAHSDGCRLALVITGKGRAGGPDAPLPVRPGALRYNVPQWLHMAPLNAIVLQVTAAHQRHGGDGAYYVYLRR